MIKGLAARARLPRLGVIRLGIKERSQAGKEYPKEVAWFVCPTELTAILGDRPTKIPVLFPSDDPERIFPTEYSRYQGRLCTLKCDGESYVEIPISGPEVHGACRKPEGEPCPCKAKPLGRLNIIVLDGPLGIYQVLIGGEQRIADLFMELEVFRQSFGRLMQIVFAIERVPQERQVRTDDGKRLPKTGYPVHVRCEVTAHQALKARGVDIHTLPGALALPPATLETEEEIVGPADELPSGADDSHAMGLRDPSHQDSEAERPPSEPCGEPLPELPPRVASTEEQHNVLIGLFKDHGYSPEAMKAWLIAKGVPPLSGMTLRGHLRTLDRLTVEKLIMALAVKSGAPTPQDLFPA